MDSGKIAALGALTAMLIAGCSSSTPSARSSSSPVPSPSAIPAATAVGTEAAPSAVRSTNADPVGIVVLTSGADGGLWTVSTSGSWSKARPIEAASAIASGRDGIAVATQDRVQVLHGSALTDLSRIELAWPGGVAEPISAFAMADDGKLALVTGKDADLAYEVADAHGRVGAPEKPASPPFTPLVAWLGEGRRLVLATDNKQVSRLGVVDAANHATVLTGLAGCRWFGVSGDGKTIAALTESALYVDATERFLANAEPAKALTLADGAVGWAVALNRDGMQAAFLSGHVAEDGSVVDVHEQILARTGASWQTSLDAKIPFTNVVGQAWSN